MKVKIWKIIFITLLACNILVVSLFSILMNGPVKDRPLTNDISNEQGIQFEVKITRNDLTRFINQYLEQKGLTSTYHYEVYVTDVVELYGKMPFFNREIDFVLTFKPVPQKNGDLILKQEAISIGKINLPVSYVMNFIGRQYQTPDWITVQPDEQIIYVALHEMKWKSNIRVKAKQFDLEHNNISFLLTLPK